MLGKICVEEDLELLGPNGGLRCVSPSVEMRVSVTPGQECSWLDKSLVDIPGFHDPWVFYSGRRELILIAVSQ